VFEYFDAAHRGVCAAPYYNLMTFGFPPKYSSRINLNLKLEDAIDLVEETLHHMHWNYSVEKPGVFSAWGTTGGAMDGQPHRTTVKVDEYDGIEVISRNLLPWPFFDGGINKEIVEMFLETWSMKSLDRGPRFSDSLPNGGRQTKTVVERDD